jgi:hypothetical protein
LTNSSDERPRVIDDQERYGADNRHKKAIKIEIRHTRVSQEIRQESADNRADYAQEDIAVPAVTGLIYELAADESCDHPQNNPANERQSGILAPIGKQKTRGGDIDNRHFVSAPSAQVISSHFYVLNRSWRQVRPDLLKE